jgi:NAD(P)-dependent dehydrogenase (short-subunit alcohol dehydrogenase family)
MAMTRTLAVEHASLGIRCNVICPGAIRTAMVGPLSKEREEAAGKAIPLGRWGTPEDVAYLALYLASDESSFMTGSVVVIDGGFTAS